MATWQRTDDPLPARPARLAALLRARGDQVLALVVLLALWQGLSLAFGTYWVGSPWGVVTRLANGAMSGEILRHASYTLLEAAAGFLIGALPAAALPFALRRLPIVTAILDPFMVGGYGAPKLALAPLFILWFGIGIESKIALVAITVLLWPACARSTPCLCRWLKSWVPTNATWRVILFFLAPCPTSSPAFASRCLTRSAAQSSPN